MTEIASSPAAAPAAPGSDGGAPAAPAPAPAAPAPSGQPAAPASQPATPNQPAAPAAQEAPQKSAADIAAEQDAKEWEDAEDEVFPGLKSAKESDKNEPAKPEEKPKEEPATPENPADKKQDAEPKPGDDANAEGAGTPKDGDKPTDDAAAPDPAAAARESRAATREYAQQVEAVKSDVREKMFADLPTVLTDRDGDPINTIEDVQRLINPSTGEAFTETEAATWLLAAQQQFNQRLDQANKQIEHIAEVNLDLKDQADEANAKYGAYLKANPDIRDAVWQQYEATLVKDPTSGIILNAPVKLVSFYDFNLKDRAEAWSKQQEAPVAPENPAAPAEPAQPVEDPEKKKQDEEAERKRRRADRSDVYGGQQPDNMSQEDREWAEAEENYLKNR